MEDDVNEKRTMTRYSCWREANFLFSNGRLSKAKCYDISSLGAGLETNESVLVGELLKLQIIAKNNFMVSVEGKVRWCMPSHPRWHSGVEFNKLLFIPLDVLI